MSLTLRGYDLFSVNELRAALQEVLLPVSAERARMVPSLMAAIRLLGMGPTHDAAALTLLKDVLNSVSPTALSAVELIKLTQDLQRVAETPIVQLAQLDVEVDLNSPLITCSNGETARTLIECATIQRDQNDQGRGTENYSG